MAERHFVPLNSPFEVELTGTRLLEAGAGTGKTWTIAALVLRLLLEQQMEIGRILVVTYTRAASGELRGRVRARLVEALAAFESGTAAEDYLRQLVARHDASEAQVRLRLAIESFDEAAIFTIHGFCQRALGESAFAAGQPFERELLSDQNEMLADVARAAWRRLMAEASPLWAQWLIDRFAGPEGLVGKIQPHLGRIDAHLAAPAVADRQAAERAFALAHADVRRLWQAAAARIIDLIAGAQLNQQSYSPKKMQPRIAALERYLAQETALLPLPEGIDHFGSAKIAAKLNKAGQLPEHPFFAGVDVLREAAGRLEAVFDHAIRRLARDFLPRARTELAERKRRGGQQSYDDLLVDLARALDGPAGPKLAEDLRARYHIALVDEFQDTDPLQLDIFTRVFGTDERPSVLPLEGRTERSEGFRGGLIFVGDPKQAIYGFRGADVFAYLAARDRADTGYALVENRRSDAPLLQAVNALFDRPQPFLLDGLPFAPAKAATLERKVCRIDDGAAPMTLWTMRQPDGTKSFTKEVAQEMAAEAVAADIARLLALSEDDRAMLDNRPLGGGDIAVLVRKHREGDAVRQALARRGIASVSMGGGSVWHGDEAEEIERLLLAIAAPARGGLVRAALATVLLGADAAQLAAWLNAEASWDARLDLFHDDQRLLRERGFMAMWRRLLRREHVVARLLARPDGERRLTNYRHLAELLQVAEHESALDIEGLARHVARQRQSPAAEEHQLRLESDARLVRIVTVHAAKGLQYPVVYCPSLWHGPERQDTRWPVLAHAENVACLDFGSERSAALRAAADREAAAEELRLAYVALTRAEHRCIVAWGKVNNCARSPLAWLLFGPREEDGGSAGGDPSGSAGDDPRGRLAAWLEARDATALEGELHALAAGLPGALAVMPPPTDGVAPLLPAAPPSALSARVFAGRVPAPWRVQSFSALAARLAEEAESADRDAVAATAAVLPEPTFAPGFSSIHAFPRGTRAGSCLHALFERIDFQERTAAGFTLSAAIAGVLDEFGYAQEWRPVLERLVADVLATPLNAAGLQLAQVARGARLVELEFAFPLGSTAARAGYMKGFIDLVFRHAGRWYIVDWKSNWLGSSRDDYATGQLEEAMRRHRYDLQLRIYTAALKRALALREPQSDWESSFGGVFYLFLRGMGPGASTGVYFSRPNETEIEACLDEAKA